MRILHAYGLAFSAEVDVIGVGGEPESVQFRILEADADVTESFLIDVDDKHGLALLGAGFWRDVYRAEEAGAVEGLAAGVQSSGRQPVTLVDGQGPQDDVRFRLVIAPDLDSLDHVSGGILGVHGKIRAGEEEGKKDNRARHRTDLRWNPSTTIRAVNQNAQKPYQYGLLESRANEIEKQLFTPKPAAGV